MKKIRSINDALLMYICTIAFVWFLYPITVIFGYFVHADGRPRFSWNETAIVGLILTMIISIIFVVFVICKLKRRKFDLEIYELEKTSYEKFLDEYLKKQNSCELEYFNFLICLDIHTQYYCSIYNEDVLISEKSFSSQEELLNTKILSGQTICDLWQYIYFRKTNGILYKNYR
jgi:hypothetical protein